jgi:hypothetical protein
MNHDTIAYALWIPSESKPRLVFITEEACKQAKERWADAYSKAVTIKLCVQVEDKTIATAPVAQQDNKEIVQDIRTAMARFAMAWSFGGDPSDREPADKALCDAIKAYRRAAPAPAAQGLGTDMFANLWVGVACDNPPSGLHEDGLIWHRYAESVQRACAEAWGIKLAKEGGAAK